MNKQQFAKFTMALKTYYPKENILPNQEAMALWYEQLKDIDYKVIEISLNKWVATNKWSPSIADIRQMSSEVTTEEIPSWSEAWQEARLSVGNYGMYQQEEALNSLSPLTRKVIEHLGFQELCTCEDIDVYRGQFRMAYENLANQEKQNAQLPDKLKTLIAQTRTKMLGVSDDKQAAT